MTSQDFSSFLASERARTGAAPSQDGGGFFGAIGGGAADVFRTVVPQEARDVGGFVINNALSGERFLNTAGGFLAGNDELGTDIGNSLGSVPKVGGLLRMGFDIAAAPLTIATAGFGNVISAPLAAGRLGVAGKIAAKAIEPVAQGNLGQRFAAESLLGTGAAFVGQQAAEHIPEGTPSVLKGAMVLGAAAVGGTMSLRAAGAKTPWLVGKEVLVDSATTLKKPELDRLTINHSIDEIIPSKNADEVLADASAHTRFGMKWRESDSGLMQKVARTLHPKDPAAAALVQEYAKRQFSGDNWRAARVQVVEHAMRVFEVDDVGRVTNIKNGRLSLEQQKAMAEIIAPIKEAKVYAENAGVKMVEITGEEIDTVRFATKMEDQPMFGDLVERLAGDGAGAYFPRVVTEVDGVATVKGKIDPFRVRAREPGFAEIPEHIATMEENMTRNIVYKGDPTQVVDDYLKAVLRKVDGAWLRETANGEAFGARTVGSYIDNAAPGIRAQAVSLQQSTRSIKEKLGRQVAKLTEKGRAARLQRQTILKTRKAAKTITKVQEAELKTIEGIEAARLKAVNLNLDSKAFRKAKQTLNRPIAKAIRDTEDGIEMLDDAKNTIADIEEMAEAAIESKVLAAEDIAATRVELKNKQAQLARTRQIISELRDAASHPLVGEGSIPRLGNSFWPQEFAKTMSDSLTSDQNSITNAIGGFNNFSRALMATMDLSAAGIQGLLALGSHPIQASQAIVRATASLANREWYSGFVKSKAGVIDGFISKGGKWAASDDMGEFMFSSKIGNIPVVGGLMKKSNLAFSRTGNLLRLQLFESALETSRLKGFGAKGALTQGVTDAEARKIVSFINSATGFHGGKPATWESVALFAPRFFKSQLDVAQRALLKGGPDADLARLTLFRTFALGATLTIAANTMRGQQTEFNPVRVNSDGTMSFNSNFMRIKNVGGQDVSVFGAWDSLLGLMTTVAVAGPMEGATRLFRTKASPAMSTVMDIIEGETFTGQQVDVMSLEGLGKAIITEATNKLPFTVQELGEGIRNREMPVGAGFNFFGTKATATTLFEDRDQLATSMFDRHWSELTGTERDSVEKARPQLFEDIRDRDESRGGLGDPISIARTQRDEIDAERIDEEGALAAALQNGQITITQLDDRMKVLQASSADQKKRVDTTLGLSFDGTNADPNQKALSDWYALRDEAKLAGTDIFDFDLFEGLEATFMRDLNPEQRRFIEERSRPEHNEALNWYYVAKDVVAQAGYYDTVDAAFQQLAGAIATVDPSIRNYSDLNAAIGAATRAGRRAEQAHLEALRNAVNQTAGAQKQLLRVGNPALDQALLTLGRVSRSVSGP